MPVIKKTCKKVDKLRNDEMKLTESGVFSGDLGEDLGSIFHFSLELGKEGVCCESASSISEGRIMWADMAGSYLPRISQIQGSYYCCRLRHHSNSMVAFKGASRHHSKDSANFYHKTFDRVSDPVTKHDPHWMSLRFERFQYLHVIQVEAPNLA
ncbi:hypothetical protein ACHQM5_019504 [Ranunculus cassubicifolius]